MYSITECLPVVYSVRVFQTSSVEHVKVLSMPDLATSLTPSHSTLLLALH